MGMRGDPSTGSTHDHRTDEICNAVKALPGIYVTETLFEQRIGLQTPDCITHCPRRQSGFFDNVFLGEWFTRLEHLKHQFC